MSSRRAGDSLRSKSECQAVPLISSWVSRNPSAGSLEWSLAVAVEQVEAAGLSVGERGEAKQEVSFADVGALAWFLRAVPWELPGFSIARHRAQLRDLHARMAGGAVSVRHGGFWLEASKARGSAQT